MRTYQLTSLAIAVAVALVASSVLAQPNRRPGGGQGGAPGGDSEIDLLRSAEVQKELELVDDQISQIQQLSEESRDAIRQLFQGVDFRNLSEDERAAMREKIQTAGNEAREKVKSVLLPHQQERLSQIHVQSQLRGGAERALGSDEVREALEITDEQLENLREKSEEITKELNEKIAQLRDEARQQLLEAVLTKSQIAKFEKMIGETFDLPQPAPSRRPTGGPQGRAPGQGQGQGQGGRGRPGGE